MSKPSARPVIRLRGVRHNNLKNFDLDLPLNKLIVITGLSGSGKSSLAFDTLYAEGQRRYIETFSPYARQFFDRMDKPQVDRIEGIPPAIALEQRNSVKTTRSTVGTMTEICDYMKVLWPAIAQLYCRQCGKAVTKESPRIIWESIQNRPEARGAGQEVIITFDLPLTEKLTAAETGLLLSRQGFQRIVVGDEIVRLEDAPRLPSSGSLTVLQDRLRVTSENRARFIEACEQAYHFGKGLLAIRFLHNEGGRLQFQSGPLRFSKHLHCPTCNIEYREPSSALFSFNNPLGACPTCRGFGRVIGIDYDLAIPDRTRTLAQGLVKPWQSGQSADCQRDLLVTCRHFEIPTHVPFKELPAKWQKLVLEGEPDYGIDEEHEWPRAWYGVKGYFRWLESRAYKMHVRVLLSRYRAYTRCPDCGGMRFRPEALQYRACVSRESGNGASYERSMTLADFYLLPVDEALGMIEQFGAGTVFTNNKALALALGEVRSRLGYLSSVGLGYLTLDRPTRSLSGGETQRVNLTTCLGTRLVNTLFVLDEPSVGLHPRDTERLVHILQELRKAGNTVLVVEHEPGVMRAADEIVDLGPGHGEAGGQVVFQGDYRSILQAQGSLTGAYLSGRKKIALPTRRPCAGNRSAGDSPALHYKLPRVSGDMQGTPAEPSAGSSVQSGRDARAPAATKFGAPEKSPLVLQEATHPFGEQHLAVPRLKLHNATKHNLHNLTVEIPLNRFVCITGVSGSGKSTLIREVLLPALSRELSGGARELKASDRLAAPEEADEKESSDSPTNSAFVEGWESLDRVLLVEQSVLGKTPRSNPAVYIGAFDYIREFFASTPIAREKGLGPSAFSFNSSQGQCQRCRGAGFEKIEMQFLSDVFIRCPDCDGRRYRPQILQVKVSPPNTKGRRVSAASLSIGDFLEATVDQALAFLALFPDTPARKAESSLRWLQEVGLGYLRVGQPINTLSGGESQRLKLVKQLADFGWSGDGKNPGTAARGLFLFDEPTTGLHYDDIAVLLRVFQRIVDAGHSIVTIEHNLEVIKSADWVIDLGPEAGDQGGRIVAAGTPEEIAACDQSHTGKALRDVLTQNQVMNPGLQRERAGQCY